MIPAFFKSNVVIAIGTLLVAAALFALGYGLGVNSERGRVREQKLTDVAAARAQDATQVVLNQGIERDLAKTIGSINDSTRNVALHVTFIQPIGREDQSAKPQPPGAQGTCSADPYLSVDAVRMLNHARGYGAAPEPARDGDAAARPGSSAQR
ncbi:hypothetical protein [Achromobacter sp. AGC39]